MKLEVGKTYKATPENIFFVRSEEPDCVNNIDWTGPEGIRPRRAGDLKGYDYFDSFLVVGEHSCGDPIIMPTGEMCTPHIIGPGLYVGEKDACVEADPPKESSTRTEIQVGDIVLGQPRNVRALVLSQPVGDFLQANILVLSWDNHQDFVLSKETWSLRGFRVECPGSVSP